MKKKLEVLKAQQNVEESQIDPEEKGSSSHKSHEQISKVIVPQGHDKPSTSKQSPIKKSESQSSAEEDIR